MQGIIPAFYSDFTNVLHNHHEQTDYFELYPVVMDLFSLLEILKLHIPSLKVRKQSEKKVIFSANPENIESQSVQVNNTKLISKM